MTLIIEKSGGLFANLFNNIEARFFGFRKRLFRIMKPAEISNPIFIVGSGRSGTDIITFTLSNSLYVDVYNEYNGEAFVNWRLKPLDDIGDLIKKSRAPCIAFKPIVETLRCKEFLDRFQNAKVLFAVRDYRDAINSMARFFGDNHIHAVRSWVESDFKNHPQASDYIKKFIKSHCVEDLSVEDACGLYWLLYNSSYHFLGLQNDPRVRVVSYEQLVRQPDKETHRLSEFLGISWSPTMIRGVYQKSIGKNSPPELSPSLQEECDRVWALFIRQIESET